MNILLAPDSFKGSINQEEACEIMAKALKEVLGTVTIAKCPIADGGEGSLSCFKNYFNYEIKEVKIHNHLNEEIIGAYGYRNDEVIIEAAKACGITLSNRLEPLVASSYGLGELVLEAIKESRPKRITFALGGTATNDLGLGMLRALGAKFYSGSSLIEPTPLTIKDITDIDLIEVERLLEGIEIIGMVDVTNPLCGPLGATAVFGPQKGVKASDIELIDEDFRHFAGLINKKYNKDYLNEAGTGAAGGLGYAIRALMNGRLRSGIESIFRLANFDELIRNCDYVITGEGKLDSQSLNGKVIDGVLKRARLYNKRAIIVTGVKEIDIKDDNIYLVEEIRKKGEPLEEAIKNAKENLYNKMLEIARKL